MRRFWVVFCWEWRELVQNFFAVLSACAFFLLIMMLFPLAVGSARDLLAEIAPGVVWVAFLLSVMLSAERLFKADFQSGVIAQLFMFPGHVSILLLAKILAHWLLNTASLLVLMPLAVVMLYLPWSVVDSILLGILLGSPSLMLISALGTALTVSLPRAGMVMALIVLPLFIPVLIFGVSMIQADLAGQSYLMQIYALLAFLVFSLLVLPWFIMLSFKIQF